MLEGKFNLIKELPLPEDYLKLRKQVGFNPKTIESVELGLPNSWYRIHIKDKNKVIAMGRIIGDGSIAFQILDVIALPNHQKQGLGKLIMVL